MSTPDTKLQLPRPNSSSKYLTPCRTFGLKRKSTSPRTPGSKLVCRSEESDSPISSVKHTSKTPLQNIENKILENVSVENSANKAYLTRKDLLINECTESASKDTSVPLKPEEHETKIRTCEPISNAKLMELIKSINGKVEKINNLKRNAIYTKKHDINKLRRSTDKWKNACKEVVMAICETSKLKGHDVSVSDVLDQHNIPYSYIGYNEEAMDFD